jgi:ABC-2 type transport system ATP-binding protein
MTVHGTNNSTPAVEAHGLGRRFGDRWVLQDVDLAAAEGTVLGLLGPNGAGKTTTIRILTTLLAPDRGSARVAGHDVVTAPHEVRRRIGVAGQSATVDELLTGRSNLELVGRLYHLPRGEVRARARELLRQFDLEDAGDRLVKTYSGGMRRRLDLAASLVARPAVLFLDEPTTGLDPRSRLDLWTVLRGLVRDGTTIVLTTQYLDEADQLADVVTVVDAGRIIASGAPDELKARTGGDRLEVTVRGAEDLAPTAEALERIGLAHAAIDLEERRVAIPLAPSTSLLDVVRALDEAGIDAEDVARRSASLDDVFLSLTGHDTRIPEPVA